VWKHRELQVEDGVFPDVRDVADYLAQSLQPGDVVIMNGVFKTPITYYLSRRGIDVRQAIFIEPHPVKGRAMLVELEPISPLPMSLAEFEVVHPSHTRPKLMRAFDFAKVYEVRVLPATTSAAAAMDWLPRDDVANR
jgi:hypothetical protein